MVKRRAEIMNYSPGERLILLYDYLLENTNRDNVASMSQIIRHLKEMGAEVSEKTIYIDFAKLRHTKKLDILYDKDANGYYINNPPFEPYELRLMVDGIQSLKFITQEQAQQLSKKIARLGDVHNAKALNRQAYVANRIRSINESVVEETDILHKCIEENQKVSFKFFHYCGVDKKRQYTNKGKPRVVSPFALLWNDGNQYLYAYTGKEFRFFRVDRMDEIMPVPEERDGVKEYKTEDMTARQSKLFNMFPGKEYTVRLRCINKLAEVIMERFGRDTILTPCDKDHFTTLAKVEISDSFFAWVASFGKRMQILSPATIVQEMKEFIEKVSEMYKDEGEK